MLHLASTPRLNVGRAFIDTTYMKITKTNWRDVFKAKLASVETMQLKGYELIEEVFADSSGLGQDDELALSVPQFEKRVQELLTQYGTLTAKITRHGMFQVYVGFFRKAGRSNAEKIGNNTYKVTYGVGHVAYRLHNTDVVTFLPNGDIKLDTGGWDTVTTRNRINRYIPSQMAVIRDKGETYFKYGTQKVLFTDGMIVRP